MRDVVVELPMRDAEITAIQKLLSEGYDYGGEEIWSEIASTDFDLGDCFYFDLRVVSELDKNDADAHDVYIELVITDHHDEEVVSSDFLYEWEDEYTIEDFDSGIRFVLKTN